MRSTATSATSAAVRRSLLSPHPSPPPLAVTAQPASAPAGITDGQPCVRAGLRGLRGNRGRLLQPVRVRPPGRAAPSTRFVGRSAEAPLVALGNCGLHQRIDVARHEHAQIDPRRRHRRRAALVVRAASRQHGATWAPGWSRCPRCPGVIRGRSCSASPRSPSASASAPAAAVAVGRTAKGRPGRTEGFCTECGARFSFTPKLWPGDLVAGQYKVAGCHRPRRSRVDLSGPEPESLATAVATCGWC